jgi:pyruvate kinase
MDFALDSLEESEDQTTAVAASSCILAHQLNAALIVVATSSGKTAMRVASYRPTTPIIAISDNKKTWKQLALIWGVKSFLAEDYSDDEHMFYFAKRQIIKKGYAEKGERVVFVSGVKPHTSGGTNSITVETL